ncbi:ABC transporter permease [Plantibacter sp. YIM 135249]|uniref:ABC transporter permease n=1 Tax=Plantibacter sp. YIM 135249 TaxID=3423918 RepID=UPI003D347497
MDWWSAGVSTAVIPTVIAVVVLAGVTIVMLRWSGAPSPTAPLWALLRGSLQLVVLSLILSGVIGDPYLVAAALVVMFVAAAVTVHRRIRSGGASILQIIACMGAGIIVALGTVFALGAVEFSPRYVLALAGIVIGNTMSITTLAGRTFGHVVIGRWDEVEGWLALGARPIEATRSMARQSIHSSLIPSIDQTKTTGLVVLPGAFVGAIFGGASPLEAGRFQIVVLACILAAGSITAVLLMRMIGAVATKPDDDGALRHPPGQRRPPKSRPDAPVPHVGGEA